MRKVVGIQEEEEEEAYLAGEAPPPEGRQGGSAWGCDRGEELAGES